MSGRRYARLPKTLVDVGSPAAVAFAVQLAEQRLRHGLPAARRGGALRALAIRVGLPRRPVAAIVRRRGGEQRPDLDALLDGLSAAGLAEPPLSAVALEGRAGLAVFVFPRGASTPSILVKVPGDPERLEREARALETAGPAAVAPAFLGRVGGAYVQAVVAGAPLDAGTERGWLPEHADIADGLARLASTTRTAALPEQLRESLLVEGLGAQVRRTVAAAERDLSRLSVAVLQHGDTSPQNCLVAGGRLAGLVDWEQGRFEGAPGFDVWNLAVASLEHGIGLRRWGADSVVDGFRRAWSSAFFDGAREAARTAARAAGVGEELLDPLEVAFFARRVVVRSRNPGAFPTSAATAARMLDVACAH